MSIARYESDEALMLRTQADDTQAFGLLYDRFAGAAFRVAQSVCHDSGSAEEVVQEGFLSMWRSRARYQPQTGSAKAWALSIIRNRAIDAVRRAAAERRGRSVELPPTVPAPGSDAPDRKAIARCEGAELRARLQQLPDAQAEVITLAFFGQLTHVEIAEHLSLPEGTVKGRMRLGLHKLRAHMEASG